MSTGAAIDNRSPSDADSAAHNAQRFLKLFRPARISRIRDLPQSNAHRDAHPHTRHTSQRARQSNDTLDHRHTYTLINTPAAHRSTARRAHAPSARPCHRTEREGDPPRPWSICESRSLRGFPTPRIPKRERRTIPYRLRPTLRSSLMPRSLVSGRPKYTKIEGSVQRPSDNETRKWRRRQSGRFADEIAYVAHKLAMGNLTDISSRGPGMVLGSSPRSDLGGNTLTSTTEYYHSISSSATLPILCWPKRSAHARNK